MSDERSRLLGLLTRLAYEKRKVVLSSGRESDFYIDTKQATLSAEGHYLVGEGRTLVVQLELPDGPVHINVVPVRYERMDEDETATGYLIGSRITEISDQDSKRFMAYIGTLPP